MIICHNFRMQFFERLLVLDFLVFGVRDCCEVHSLDQGLEIVSEEGLNFVHLLRILVGF